MYMPVCIWGEYLAKLCIYWKFLSKVVCLP